MQVAPLPPPPPPQQSAGPADGNAQASVDADAAEHAQQQQGEGRTAAVPTAPATAPLQDNTYMSREKRHTERERSGELTAKYVKNDGSIENGRLLTGLKNVFSKCLPNMPKEYICRLIFERRHKCAPVLPDRRAVHHGCCPAACLLPLTLAGCCS
jgi:histone acetyltransferase